MNPQALNRAQRRAIERERMRLQTASLKELSPGERQAIEAGEAKKRELERNGITINDLKQEWRNGYKEGLKDSNNLIIKASCAAAMIALHEEFGFGSYRLERFAARMDDELLYCVEHQDIIDKCFKVAGITIVDSEVFNRVQRTNDKPKRWRRHDKDKQEGILSGDCASGI